jgi:hypothetical protein
MTDTTTPADAPVVAWVDSLDRPQPHCVTSLKYCSVGQHDRGEHLLYAPLIRQSDHERIVAELRAQLQAAEQDARRLDWLEHHDGRFSNIDRITSVNSRFNGWPSLRIAIDHCLAKRHAAEGGA